jgi:hypothetical protein
VEVIAAAHESTPAIEVDADAVPRAALITAGAMIREGWQCDDVDRCQVARRLADHVRGRF